MKRAAPETTFEASETTSAVTHQQPIPERPKLNSDCGLALLSWLQRGELYPLLFVSREWSNMVHHFFQSNQLGIVRLGPEYCDYVVQQPNGDCEHLTSMIVGDKREHEGAIPRGIYSPNLFKLAASAGNLEVIKLGLSDRHYLEWYFLTGAKNEYEGYSERHFRKTKKPALLERLHLFSEIILPWAALHNHANIVDYVVATYYTNKKGGGVKDDWHAVEAFENITKNAIKGDHIALVRMYSQAMPTVTDYKTQNYLTLAISSGSMKTLQWLECVIWPHHNIYAANPSTVHTGWCLALENNAMGTALYLVDKNHITLDRFKIQPNEHDYIDRLYRIQTPSWTKMAAKGYLLPLMYGHTNGLIPEWEGPHLFGVAAAGDQLETLQWLEDRGFQRSYDTCARAALHGNINCLKWAIEHGHPTNSHWVSICGIRSGRLDIVKLIETVTCPIDPIIAGAYAVYYGFHHISAYLQSHPNPLYHVSYPALLTAGLTAEGKLSNGEYFSVAMRFGSITNEDKFHNAWDLKTLQELDKQRQTNIQDEWASRTSLAYMF